MFPMFFAQRVIMGRERFEDVPDSIKPDTYKHLKESGMEHLAGDYKPQSNAQ